MGRACWPKHQQPSKMKLFMLLALAAGQINSQEDGSGHGGMGMDGSGSGMGGSGMGGSGYDGMGSGMGMGSGYGGDWYAGECCPTKKIWGSMYPEKDGIYDLVMDGDMVMNMMGSGMGGMGYGMGSGMGYGMGSGSGMGSGEGMGSTPGMGSGGGSGMGMGYGMGMDMDMDNMQWPKRCRRRCIYKKRNSYDDRMYCFARSEYSQLMCLAGDYDGEKPVNVDEFGYG